MSMESDSDRDDALKLQSVLDDNRLIDIRIAQLIQDNRAIGHQDVLSSSMIQPQVWKTLKQENDIAVNLLYQRKQKNQLLIDALCDHSWGEPFYEQRICEHCFAIKQ